MLTFIKYNIVRVHQKLIGHEMMIAAQQYGSSSSEDGDTTKSTHNHSNSSSSNNKYQINSAPAILDTDLNQHRQIAIHNPASSSSLTIKNNVPDHRNLPYSISAAPVLGPAHPYSVNQQQSSGILGSMKLATGLVESTAMEDFSFAHNYHEQFQGDYIAGSRENRRKKNGPNENNTMRLGQEEEEEEEDGSIWAPMAVQKKRHEQTSTSQPATTTVIAPAVILSEAQKQIAADQAERRRLAREMAEEEKDDQDFDHMVERKRAHLLPGKIQPAIEPESSFHDSSLERDYQGRAWTHVPNDLKAIDDVEDQPKAYLPKRCIHEYRGHAKGVQAIRYFPKFGHLLLSASMDGTVKIWDTTADRSCRRTYAGHAGAVRDVAFSADGSKFLSCAYDRYTRLWDTETGQVVQTFTSRRVPYCAKFCPLDENQFVIGDSNNMVVQFDCTSGEITQRYNYHLQAVNSVTFLDAGRKMMSTSDDKKILIWEWNTPVPIKYIADAGMHSMPSVSMHPSQKFVAGQCLNNQIEVYTATGSIKKSGKKVFRGHVTSGYACQIGFSPNGKFVMSGDGQGRVFFWDWDTTRNLKRLQAHAKGPTMGAIWHPLATSQVATCGWDGLIKLWD